MGLFQSCLKKDEDSLDGSRTRKLRSESVSRQKPKNGPEPSVPESPVDAAALKADAEAARWKEVVMVASSRFICVSADNDGVENPVFHLLAQDILQEPVPSSVCTDMAQRFPNSDPSNSIGESARGVPEEIASLLSKLSKTKMHLTPMG